MVLYKECTDEMRIESSLRGWVGVKGRIDAGGSRPNPFLNWWWATLQHHATTLDTWDLMGFGTGDDYSGF